MKPFTTYRQQLRILRDRGLDVPDGSKAMRILERESYYSLINGYKDLFLVLDNHGKPIAPEQYKIGAKFDEITSLYNFDRDLRNILLEYLLMFESSIKSKISYRFTEKYKESHAYLDIRNFTRDPAQLKDVLGLISQISHTISSHGNKKGRIRHYLDSHDGVPLWVLIGYMTLGNVNYFYKCLEPTLKNQISKDFAEAYKKEYGILIHFTPEMLSGILKTANFFRNVCAHEERMYSFRVNKPSKNADLASTLRIDNILLENGSLFSLVAFLELVLTKNDHKNLTRKLNLLFKKYRNQFSSVNFNGILEKMGFPQD